MSKPARSVKRRVKAKEGGTRPLHILVVENHPDTRHGVKAFLDSLGHEAACAEDKASALTLAARQKFDLILSDISLPDGDGWELLRALEARNQRPPHAIAMSGLGDLANQSRSQAAGFEMHLVKPFRPEELEAALLQAVGDTKRGRVDLANPTSSTQPTRLKQTLHDGICQQLAAAALLQSSLTHALKALAEVPDGEVSARLPNVIEESQRINRLIDETLAETMALMRSFT